MPRNARSLSYIRLSPHLVVKHSNRLASFRFISSTPPCERKLSASSTSPPASKQATLQVSAAVRSSWAPVSSRNQLLANSSIEAVAGSSSSSGSVNVARFRPTPPSIVPQKCRLPHDWCSVHHLLDQRVRPKSSSNYNSCPAIVICGIWRVFGLALLQSPATSGAFDEEEDSPCRSVSAVSAIVNSGGRPSTVGHAWHQFADLMAFHARFSAVIRQFVGLRRTVRAITCALSSSSRQHQNPQSCFE